MNVHSIPTWMYNWLCLSHECTPPIHTYAHCLTRINKHSGWITSCAPSRSWPLGAILIIAFASSISKGCLCIYLSIDVCTHTRTHTLSHSLSHTRTHIRTTHIIPGHGCRLEILHAGEWGTIVNPKKNSVGEVACAQFGLRGEHVYVHLSCASTEHIVHEMIWEIYMQPLALVICPYPSLSPPLFPFLPLSRRAAWRLWSRCGCLQGVCGGHLYLLFCLWCSVV